MIPKEKFINYLISIVTSISMIYLFEFYLTIKNWIPFESKTKIEFLDELKRSNNKVFPNNIPRSHIETNGFQTKKGSIFPLGTISNTTTIFDNECGYYPVIETDEYGFNNPKGLYNKNHIDIMLVGDSFTEGMSVKKNENIQSLLNQFGIKTISLGKISNGPLIQLASIKEYAEWLQPKIVLWLYYVNDLDDLNFELTSKLLNNYLVDENFSQNLFKKQDVVDSLLTIYLDDKWEDALTKNNSVVQEWIKLRIFNPLKLTLLRSRLNLNQTPRMEHNQNPIFKTILNKAEDMVSKWGGKFYFVYLPSFNEYTSRKDDINKSFVIKVVNDLEIPLFDIQKEAFYNINDPLSIFPFPKGAHYNAKGYRLVAEAIKNKIIHKK